MHSANRIRNSLLLTSIVLLAAHGFGRSSLLSARIPDRKPTTLFYIDHDPVLERSIARPPLPTSNKKIKKLKTQSNGGVQDQSWNEQYQALLQFKRHHGHCLVPQHYPPNTKLGHWVMAQRRYFSQNKSFSIRQMQRRDLLKDAGFVFRVDRRGPRMSKMNFNGEIKSRSKQIDEMEDFVGFMIANDKQLSEKDKREAWKKRFSVYEM
jgi:hypothetical protein